ncbi:hypothetical protein K7711_37475 [Nocardia sp. CA2R105]|uniref:hypothetical protein n=1 Tax=Nocardia coffeae TaxID=2873381 RepID=UPI001CA76EE3|nr:hypothetical protein [Nocardia coffeae]MBY8862215.1 hypothetical protein [Nocardia coffeae]
MRFHLIDRIESWDADHSIVARKAVSVYENHWQTDESGPVLPFGLALEALCQAGAWLVLLSSEHRKRAALLSLGEVRVLRDAVPGDVLRMTAQVTSKRNRTAMMDGRVEVGGEPILVVHSLMCAFVDAERLDDPVDTARMADMLLGRGPMD